MTRKEPKEKRIEEILDAAVKEFVEKGYEGTSMESISARARLTKGGLYHHFNSKDDILLAANDKFMEPILDLMNKAVQDPSPVAGLKTYILKYLKHWSGHQHELVFTLLSLTKSLSSPEMWPCMDEYAKQMIAFYESMFARGVECGELKPHDSKSRAIALIGAIDGISGYMVMCTGLSPETIARHFEKAFIDDLLLKTMLKK